MMKITKTAITTVAAAVSFAAFFMKSTLKFFMIMLLPVVAAWVTSCQDDPNWDPTWALPLLKSQTITIGDFIEPDAVKEVNDKVRAQWDSYVAERFGLTDTANVDSIAYVVLTEDENSTYVAFGNDGKPVLNDSTKRLLEENLEGGHADKEKKIKQVNDFLQAYWEAHPELNNQSKTKSTSQAKAGPRADRTPGDNKSYGGNTAVSNLLDAMIHPTDVFITAANLLSTMGEGYLDSINSQIDDILTKASQTAPVDFNLKDYVGGADVGSLEVGLSIANALPFEIELQAYFVADGTPVEENRYIINEKIASNSSEKTYQQSFKGNSLKTIAERSTGVIFSVKCTSKTITERDLRELSKKNISYSLRVKVQAPIPMDTF
ncbi:MAG: hypothetical protein LBB79_02810 [Prevotellaceae bacterium]|jgi:hypothetical protein|nr:hypothetical protein [Prevotellaceae bacterium]